MFEKGRNPCRMFEFIQIDELKFCREVTITRTVEGGIPALPGCNILVFGHSGSHGYNGTKSAVKGCTYVEPRGAPDSGPQADQSISGRS